MVCPVRPRRTRSAPRRHRKARRRLCFFELSRRGGRGGVSKECEKKTWLIFFSSLSIDNKVARAGHWAGDQERSRSAHGLGSKVSSPGLRRRTFARVLSVAAAADTDAARAWASLV
eukprot:scaffold314872_cov24-Tisochrysis_lutea.AAC.1